MPQGLCGAESQGGSGDVGSAASGSPRRANGKPPFKNHSGLANLGYFWRTKRSSFIHAPKAWLGGMAPTETSQGCVSAELPLAVALRCPGRDGDRCHTPDKMQSIPLMDKHSFSSPCQDGTAHSQLEHRWWEGKCQEGLVSPELCHPCAVAVAPQQIPVWMAQPAVCHTPGVWECIEGKGATPGNAQGNKNSKRKRRSCRKTLTAQSPQTTRFPLK